MQRPSAVKVRSTWFCLGAHCSQADWLTRIQVSGPFADCSLQLGQPSLLLPYNLPRVIQSLPTL